ncbi:MAG: tRNA (N(6)-L-threonylcarbamoyladenosine(37)-C(2))-methylthiotransferase [Candidatus Helarchaeota archaeon]
MEGALNNIHIITYGCSYNQATSEMISGLLSKKNYALVDNPNDADVVIILSCIVKTPTENKILYKIKSFFEQYPGKKIIIGGCLPEVIPEKIKAISEKINFFGPHYATEIVNVVEETIAGKKIELIGKRFECKLEKPRKKINPIIGIVQISQGCNSFCSYCCVKLAMGDILSYTPSQIKNEIINQLNSGSKEIWITAQDTAAYKYENYDLCDLLNEILKIHGDFFIRIGMMNPKNAKKILKKLTNSYSNEKIYKFLHLPLQSGDNKILDLMNRNYNVQDFLSIVNDFRKKFPRLTISTDLIVGFPGETETQFSNSLKILEKIKPDIVNISRFGARPKTAAKSMKNRISANIIKNRSKKATELVNNLTLQRNYQWIGWEGNILISEKSKYGDWTGRNFAYKPVVIKSQENLLGKYLKVHIDKAGPGYLIGHLL